MRDGMARVNGMWRGVQDHRLNGLRVHAYAVSRLGLASPP
jgi:hypothetical protein